jgi:hypothetical protein
VSRSGLRALRRPRTPPDHPLSGAQRIMLEDIEPRARFVQDKKTREYPSHSPFRTTESKNIDSPVRRFRNRHADSSAHRREFQRSLRNGFNSVRLNSC